MQTETRRLLAFIIFTSVQMHGLSPSAIALADDAPSKVPPPTVKDMTTAAKLVNSLYASEIAKATTASGKLALARTLRKAANEETGDMAGKYALYLKARDLACDAGDLYVASRAIEDLNSAFDANTTRLSNDIIPTVFKKLQSPADELVFVTDAALLSQSAVLADDLDLAKRFDTAAMTTARHLGNRKIIADATARSQELSELPALTSHLQAARASLARNASDEDANSEVGQYECLVKGNWQVGLPMLARGGEPVLRPLAAMDLDSAGHEAAIADGWYGFAEKRTGIQKHQALLRAKKWYTAAASLESGLAKAKVTKRLDELQGITEISRGLDEIVVVALIDGESELHLSSDGIFWREKGVDKPGLIDGKVNLPTFLNEIPWMPEWGKPKEHRGDDVTVPLPIVLDKLNFDFQVMAVSGDENTKNPLGITAMDKRDSVSISSESNEQVLWIPDSQPGCRWYKIRIFRKPAGDDN